MAPAFSSLTLECLVRTILASMPHMTPALVLHASGYPLIRKFPGLYPSVTLLLLLLDHYITPV